MGPGGMDANRIRDDSMEKKKSCCCRRQPEGRRGQIDALRYCLLARCAAYLKERVWLSWTVTPPQHSIADA